MLGKQFELAGMKRSEQGQLVNARAPARLRGAGGEKKQTAEDYRMGVVNEKTIGLRVPTLKRSRRG